MEIGERLGRLGLVINWPDFLGSGIFGRPSRAGRAVANS
ncbi:hypothetical protein CASFOL_024250 [Castilleja foliolosa]|uniref:Uncharacterized protein n=1 Tax=Castilleja foliolosa TaxID=1961234 RepID=A0ABD3CMS8_9LAMI